MLTAITSVHNMQGDWESDVYMSHSFVARFQLKFFSMLSYNRIWAIDGTILYHRGNWIWVRYSTAHSCMLTIGCMAIYGMANTPMHIDWCHRYSTAQRDHTQLSTHQPYTVIQTLRSLFTLSTWFFTSYLHAIVDGPKLILEWSQWWHQW